MAMSPILSLAMRNVFFVWQRECVSRMLSWSIIQTTHRMSGLWAGCSS